MRHRYHRLPCSQVDDTDGLTQRDVLAAISLRFFNREVVILSIAAVLTLVVECKEGMTGALEGDELIAERHLTPYLLEGDAIKRVLIMGKIVVIVANHAKPQFLTFHLPVFHFYFISQFFTSTVSLVACSKQRRTVCLPSFTMPIHEQGTLILPKPATSPSFIPLV